jgi:hypothetical protein
LRNAAAASGEQVPTNQPLSSVDPVRSKRIGQKWRMSNVMKIRYDAPANLRNRIGIRLRNRSAMGAGKVGPVAG